MPETVEDIRAEIHDLETARNRRQRPNRDYYLSTAWQVLRRAALADAGHKCQLCSGTERLNVHHNNYVNWGHETLADLVVLCRRCHAKHHNVAA
jgi:5-methylcytosine-specific restriction endonuclease McrA